MNIIDYIPHGHDRAMTSKQIARLTGLCERNVRAEISRARKENIILNMQDRKGYFRPIEGEDELIKRFLLQEESRNKTHRETLVPLREYLYIKGIE